MKGHGSKASRQRDEAILALLSQRSIEEAARVAGVAPNTLRRWLKEPEFDSACRSCRCKRLLRVYISRTYSDERWLELVQRKCVPRFPARMGKSLPRSSEFRTKRPPVHLGQQLWWRIEGWSLFEDLES